MTSIFYAGVGSRETPNDILEMMTLTAKALHDKGYTLRSGGAIGADTAFERGTDRKEIFLATHATKEAISEASRFHPAWDRCTSYARQLHGRNMMILLGADLLAPVRFVLCWTKNGGATGGTGQAIRAANHYRIPVFNLFFSDVKERVRKLIL